MRFHFNLPSWCKMAGIPKWSIFFIVVYFLHMWQPIKPNIRSCQILFHSGSPPRNLQYKIPLTQDDLLQYLSLELRLKKTFMATVLSSLPPMLRLLSVWTARSGSDFYRVCQKSFVSTLFILALKLLGTLNFTFGKLFSSTPSILVVTKTLLPDHFL